MSGYHLRYRRDTHEGEKFASIRYPWHTEVSHEKAEQMQAAMPRPELFEIVEEGE